jgi:hypothetical protein
VLRRSVIVFAVISASWGAFVHYRGATTDLNRWNADPDNVDANPARIWQWRDMQIFR